MAENEGTEKEGKLFVVKVYNQKRDGFIEYLHRAETPAKARGHFVEVYVATADDVYRLKQEK